MIGSRRSTLALIQSGFVRDHLLAANPGLRVKIKEIVTSGDRILDSPLATIGDRGLFVKELEEALLTGEVDLAVHSAKDVPTVLPSGLVLRAIPEREDPADVFVGRLRSMEELGPGCRVGTSSLRRRSQLLAHFPGLHIVDIRGNVETRVRKIKELGLDGTILAAAGLRRLGRLGDAAFAFPAERMVSAVGQGALAIEAREDDKEIGWVLGRLNHLPTERAVRAERALMRALEGGCQVPIGARGLLHGEELRLLAYIGLVDGSRSVRMEHWGSADDPEAVGEELARRMLAAGADDILRQVRIEQPRRFQPAPRG